MNNKIQAVVPKAAFRFEDYEVISFKFEKPENISEEIAIFFDPKGTYNKEKKSVSVLLGVDAIMDHDTPKSHVIVSMEVKCNFNFENVNEINDIPDYFYKNSLAIVFPYLRSFISTLTFQANLRPPMIMPLLNLSDLSTPFKESMKVE